MNVNGQPSHSWEDAAQTERNIWQPVVLITPVRIECTCGAKAIFLCLGIDDDGDVTDGQAYCQDCFQRAQEG